MSTEASWRATFVEGCATEWIPLVEIGSSGMAIGVSRDGIWLVGDSAEGVPVSSHAGALRILPVLEEPPEATIQELAAFVASYQGTVESVPERPLLAAIKTGLTGGSDYWADLAVTWLRFLKPSSEISEILEKLVSQPWASQKTRHAARRILRGAAGSFEKE